LNGFKQWLADNEHLMAARVQEFMGIPHDADMTLPEYQVTAL
jgi:hypothetical protein